MMWSSLLVALASLSTIQAYRSKGGSGNLEVLPGHGQYIFEKNQYTWNDALQNCRVKGGSLAVIDTPEEASFLIGLLSKNGATTVHSGFHDMYKQGTYITIEGKDVSKCTSQWAAGYPKEMATNKCGGLCLTGITNNNCMTPKQSICELRLSSNYDFIQGAGFYKYHSEPLTWPEAWQKCRSEGTHLIVVYTEGEYNVIKAKYPTNSAVWVGAHRLYGAPVTILDEPTSNTGYDKWIKKVGPHTQFPYVELHYNIPNGGYDAQSATAKRPFICERRINLY